MLHPAPLIVGRSVYQDWPSVSVYAGRYGGLDLSQPWTVSDGGYYRESDLPPLFKLALGVREIQGTIGGAPYEALMFLLCDLRFDVPYASARFGNGIEITIADLMISPREVAEIYSKLRKKAGIRRGRDIRKPQEHTDALVAFVERRKREQPRIGWRQLFEEWSNGRPKNSRGAYANHSSMKVSFYNAKKRIREATT